MATNDERQELKLKQNANMKTENSSETVTSSYVRHMVRNTHTTLQQSPTPTSQITLNSSKGSMCSSKTSCLKLLQYIVHVGNLYYLI